MTVVDFDFVVTLKDASSTVAIKTVTFNKSYTLPVPEKNGYTFLGWFDSPSNGNQYTNADGHSLRNWLDFGNKVLYARWSSN